MNRNWIAALALAACMLLALVPTAGATSGLRTEWRNTYPGVCSTLYNLSCSMCHTSAPALNAYGQDYLDNGLSSRAIEGLDSDGDGYTNGQEILVDCTNPSNASDHGTVPADGLTWSAIKALFH